MNKLGAVGAVAALGLLVAGGIIAVDSAVTDTKTPVLVMDPAEARIAIADKQCLLDEGVTVETLNTVCEDWWLRGPYVECVTDRVAVHKCEVALQDLPDAAFVVWGVCRYQEDGEWQVFVGGKPIGWTPPAGWTCVVVVPRLVRTRSQSHISDWMTVALTDKCGWEVQPDSWGSCPHCLIWPEGCGPCRSIADKYGRDWPGHEAECGAE